VALVPELDIIEVPLNITEDRLIGTIDIEKAITTGKRYFEPGLLAKAHGNVLYVDEVNLLSDNIVNCLLDVCQSGVNKVEREGISYTHEARFVLIGTMNPEEGMLSTQFLDRFGMYVKTEGCNDISERKEILRRRMEYETNPQRFIARYEAEAKKLQHEIAIAAKLLETIEVDDSIMRLAADIATQKNCAGHRADIIMVEAAKALAAWRQRKHVTIKDVIEVAEFVLPHRAREMSNAEWGQTGREEGDHEKNKNNREEKGKALPDESDAKNENYNSRQSKTTACPETGNSAGNTKKEETSRAKNGRADDTEQFLDNINKDNVQQPESIFKVIPINVSPIDRIKRKGSGKRTSTKSETPRGRYVRYRFPVDRPKDIAFDATLRAAAPYQNTRDRRGNAVAIEKQDFREKVREKRVGNIILFVVDASGSMGARERMKVTKGAILSLLNDAYQKRDMVGMVAFRKNKAEVLLNITRSVDLAMKCLKDLPTGGRTPLSAGLLVGYEILKARKIKDPEMVPLFVLVSDGRANVSLSGDDPVKEAKEIAARIAAEKMNPLVIDTEDEFLSLGIAKEVADAMGARYYKINDLKAGNIEHIVREMSNSR
jgi:magnesium chelatase subunit D